ncbi:Flp pilus assembly protein CpaB [Granulicella paludicola]|uniref:Flp pilus assembly protein CpaB n=1 Tax=Granulicella paludicola TaxID=474951 RepID=UPI0021DF5665|nr:Flp pilus assembly protein CpaB [Granulicella paludicola]
MKTQRLLVALVLAITVSGLCTLWLRKIAGAKGSNGHRKYVAVTQPMTAGDVLHASALKMVEWPSDIPLTGAFTAMDQVDGRTLLYPIAGGQPVLDAQLSAAGSGPGLSPKIPDGMRAISLKSDEVVGVAGFLLPGTHVDVLVTYHISPSPDPLTATVLQDVQVLTAGQKMQPDPEGKPNTVNVVTLLVTPDDAEKVTLASSEGTVHFVLRNGADRGLTQDSPANLAEFGGGVKPHPQPAAAPVRVVSAAPTRTSYSIQIIRGDKQSVETF